MHAMAQWDPTEFQRVVNDFLARQDWTQADLARAAGISPGVVNRWMQPKNSAMLVRPTDPPLRKVAPVMRMNVNDLLLLAGRVDPEPSDQDRDIALATLIADLEHGWQSASDDIKRAGSEAVRAIFRVHRERRPAHRRPTKEAPTEGDTTWAGGLMPA